MPEVSETHSYGRIVLHPCALRFKKRLRQVAAHTLWSKLKKDTQGLVVAIAVDAETKTVLMQAYQDETAFIKSIESGLMHYHSRSRAALWLKGESSGHYQHIHALHVDCDKDSLLYTVEQEGAACHTGAFTCYYRDITEFCT